MFASHRQWLSLQGSRLESREHAPRSQMLCECARSSSICRGQSGASSHTACGCKSSFCSPTSTSRAFGSIRLMRGASVTLCGPNAQPEGAAGMALLQTNGATPRGPRNTNNRDSKDCTVLLLCDGVNNMYRGCGHVHPQQGHELWKKYTTSTHVRPGMPYLAARSGVHVLYNMCADTCVIAHAGHFGQISDDPCCLHRIPVASQNRAGSCCHRRLLSAPCWYDTLCERPVRPNHCRPFFTHPVAKSAVHHLARAGKRPHQAHKKRARPLYFSST